MVRHIRRLLLLSAARGTRAFSANAAKRVLVPVANGSEEIELTCITDTLVRAGAEVTIASVEAGTTCVMSRGLTIVADARVDALEPTDWDLVVCPAACPRGRLRDSEALDAILRAQDARGAPLAAVCASPAVVLQPKGLLDKRSATCYRRSPSSALGAVADGDVVRDGHVTTSRGPGTSLAFALDLVDQLYGPEKAAELRAQMLV
ncbi:hypothetical protein JL722_13062 [Aureococcus anophagefferens]|nr:hypothetical protein JL722_13062 [Aureococcus anophagefferens]